MNKRATQGITSLVIIAFGLLGHAHAEPPQGTGKRFVQEAMALVLFAEMGNIGARDPECKGMRFPVADISSLVESEIAPTIRTMARIDRDADPTRHAEATEMIALVKKAPYQRDGGVSVVQKAYDQQKQEARASFGVAGACSRLSSQVQAVMHQKRLALRDINAQLSRMGPN